MILAPAFHKTDCILLLCVNNAEGLAFTYDA